MPNSKQKQPQEDAEQMQTDQPSVSDPDPREAILHRTDQYPDTPDNSYRPGDPPASQALFPPIKPADPQTEQKLEDEGK